MNWRPVDAQLISLCAAMAKCEKCSCRIGCQIRHSFYTNDLEFEKDLQITELKSRKYMSEDAAFEAAKNIRKKWIHELALHPLFSWM